MKNPAPTEALRLTDELMARPRRPTMDEEEGRGRVSASVYQRATKTRLQRHFQDVRLEWSVVTDARDAFLADTNRYAPRVDIAVGPFNTTPGRDPQISDALIPEHLESIFEGLTPNLNARCLLAVEVVYSGSSKHIMGDILNAGALGYYGLVLGREDLISKIHRITQYLELLAQLEKLPTLFQNVAALSTADFDALLR